MRGGVIFVVSGNFPGTWSRDGKGVALQAYLVGLDITEPKLGSAGHIVPILTAKLPIGPRGRDHRLCLLARFQSLAAFS